jgi:Zn-dependent protease
VTSLLGYGFLGWGKPVRTEINRLRGGLNGLVLVALAGPASNVVLAVILGILAAATVNAIPVFAGFAAQGVRLSLYLAIFNMLPVPPLDGSKLLLAVRIPPVIYMEVARAGFMVLIVLMSFTNAGLYMSEWADTGARAIFSVLR